MKKILITGASGFLGSKIYEYLKGSNYVDTLDLSNATFNYDLTKSIPVFNKKYDLVIHCAGKAHSIPKNKIESKFFFDINLQGSINLLASFESKIPKNLIFISSVSVYGLTTGSLVNENASLKASDPYGLSKIKAEQYISSWGKTNGVKILILRLPLLAGLNPPGNLNKMINSIKYGYFFNVGSNSPKKSLLLVTDLCKHLMIFYGKSGVYNLTDGYNPTVSELSYMISKQLNKKPPIQLPYLIVKLFSLVGDVIPFFPINSISFQKLTSELTFDDSKARKELGWNSRRVLESFKIS